MIYGYSLTYLEKTHTLIDLSKHCDIDYPFSVCLHALFEGMLPYAIM